MMIATPPVIIITIITPPGISIIVIVPTETHNSCNRNRGYHIRCITLEIIIIAIMALKIIIIIISQYVVITLTNFI